MATIRERIVGGLVLSWWALFLWLTLITLVGPQG